jgi:amino acid transporter
MCFLFICQTMIQAPLVMASAAIGFAQYLSYLVPLSRYQQKAASGALVVLLVFLLYRRITSVGKISLLLWAGVCGTMVWLIWGGATHFDPRRAFAYPEAARNFSWPFFVGLGHATVQTVYTYLGYYNVCHLGAEIRDPERNIPRSIFISILGIAFLYLALQTSILGVLPWQQAQSSESIVSAFVERMYGARAAVVATIMILWIAFGSLFALTLGYSRIPYAAAVDGTFFSVFGACIRWSTSPTFPCWRLARPASCSACCFPNARSSTPSWQCASWYSSSAGPSASWCSTAAGQPSACRSKCGCSRCRRWWPSWGGRPCSVPPATSRCSAW